ncbi:hypothetical protein A9Q84_18625 [Halobacteriovorax marinus]|uniref:Rhodanese domain-containing protein n=1 Tax=Halobacteriovorax marinus TaxID=97084 RepID=A0A1Y5F612_9BACT|nr:hypothetical protein A9Q84_18625 [Halobacteriovorax marinus]
MIKTIDAKELKAKLDNGEELILIDCREQDEWDDSHIADAKFVPLSKFQELFENELPNKEAQIIIQCRSGKRSLSACQLLLDEDYDNLTNLEGGIMGWINNGYETVK